MGTPQITGAAITGCSRLSAGPWRLRRFAQERPCILRLRTPDDRIPTGTPPISGAAIPGYSRLSAGAWQLRRFAQKRPGTSCPEGTEGSVPSGLVFDNRSLTIAAQYQRLEAARVSKRYAGSRLSAGLKPGAAALRAAGFCLRSRQTAKLQRVRGFVRDKNACPTRSKWE
jgi:hypothetical protein